MSEKIFEMQTVVPMSAPTLWISLVSLPAENWAHHAEDPVFEVIVKSQLWLIRARASPLNPRVDRLSRSLMDEIFDVQYRVVINGRFSLEMPQPLSVICKLLRVSPADFYLISMRVDLASSEFSINSLTMALVSVSTSSEPILLMVSLSRIIIRPEFLCPQYLNFFLCAK